MLDALMGLAPGLGSDTLCTVSSGWHVVIQKVPTPLIQGHSAQGLEFALMLLLTLSNSGLC